MAEAFRVSSFIMLLRFSKIIYVVGSIVLIFSLSACEKKEADLGKEILIRVADRTMTVFEFNDAFEITKIAYENDIKEQPEEIQKARIRLLNQLTVEMILLERAEELRISVAEAELEQAVSAIKSDYP